MKKTKDLLIWISEFLASFISWMLLGIIIPNWQIVIKEIQEKYFKGVDKNQ